MTRLCLSGPVHVLLVLLALLPSRSARAQDPIPEVAELPDAVADSAVAFFNRPGTLRLFGEARVPAGTEVRGDLAVLGGPLVLRGRVSGSVLVINGNARLEPGAEIAGSITAVGGDVAALEGAQVGGTVVVYGAPLRYRREEDVLARAGAGVPAALSAAHEFSFGRADLTLAVRGGYNRVEGLPVVFGPRLELGHSNPTSLQALGIFRTETGASLEQDELGYHVRLEQFVGGRRALRLGGALRSEVRPIEEWGLSGRENSLATFLFHQDFRDYYERAGWSFYLRWTPPRRTHDVLVEYRHETHEAVPARGPWTVFNSDDAWRLQPGVASGRLRSVAVRAVYDTRNVGLDASSGWHVQLELERGLGGSLRLPARLDPATGEPTSAAGAAHANFSAALLDVRSYARLGPRARLALRALAGGSLDGAALPPQRQHALGGEGSLPGFAPFHFDCGARSHQIRAGDDRYHPYYGCDRTLLVQIEYHAALPFLRELNRRLGWPVSIDQATGWVLFFDAGRAWNETEAREGRGAGQDDFAVDAGLGIRLGGLGFYWARPLSGRGRELNFFIRYGPRL